MQCLRFYRDMHESKRVFFFSGSLAGDTILPLAISTDSRCHRQFFFLFLQFGTPEEVAARVVVAELNRDGILDVRLDSTRDVVLSDSRSHNNSVYYAIEYTSSGKRGIKRVLTRIGIANRMLYVLTAQVKAADFSTSIEREMRDAVDSFSVKIDY